jgi:hypothetical protein
MFSVLIIHAEDKDGYMYKVKNNSKWKTFEVGCPINHKFYHMGIVAQAVSRRPLTTQAQVSGPGQSMWTEWHWDRHFSNLFSFALSVSFHNTSPYSYIYHVGDEQ